MEILKMAVLSSETVEAKEQIKTLLKVLRETNRQQTTLYRPHDTCTSYSNCSFTFRN
jgi:hypothetical protein